jgi:ubiquinone/menaquinone biosynthesis C-methylase UbiE
MGKGRKGYKGLPLEGALARWYAKNTGRQLDSFRESAAMVARQLPGGSRVLEVAPGPGYLAIELAKRGEYQIVGLDISRTFVRMATENARKEGVPVTFRHGDAAAMPFESETFDFIVCRAAFKNFTEPVRALREMHRVLRPGGKAVILDLRRDAAPEDLDTCVDSMGLGPVDRLVTKWIFKHSLVKKAYSEAQFRQMASETPFERCEVRTDSIGLEVAFCK